MMAGLTKLLFGLRPLMLYNGEVSCQTLTGKITIMRLSTHNFQDDQDIAEEEVYTCMCVYMYFHVCVHACVFICACIHTCVCA